MASIVATFAIMETAYYGGRAGMVAGGAYQAYVCYRMTPRLPWDRVAVRTAMYAAGGGVAGAVVGAGAGFVFVAALIDPKKTAGVVGAVVVVIAGAYLSKRGRMGPGRGVWGAPPTPPP